MNSQAFLAQWDHFRQIVGIGVRLVETLPEDKLDSHPIPKMRTPKELVVHAYGTMRSILEGTVSGEIKDLDEPAIVASLKSRADLVKYCHECWAGADRAARLVTDDKLKATVKSPWADMPGFVTASIPYDEMLHHRGQLFTYLRALGCDVPMMWDFEHNASAYQPAVATA